MLDKIIKFITSIKSIVWVITFLGIAFIFVYGTYIKVSETVPTKVYAMEKDVNEIKYRVADLETEKLLINKDLTNVQTELQEIKQQLSDNQKETRAALNEINRDVKYILKNM